MLVKRAGRHFGFFKRAGRHEKGAGRRALQKKPRQNTELRGGGWVQFPGKKHYITLEWSLTAFNHQFTNGPCSQQEDRHKEGGQ